MDIKKNKSTIFLIVLILLIIILVYFLLSKNTVEHYCYVPDINRQGGINDKRVFLDFKPQSNIGDPSCRQYWKNNPIEHNNMTIEDDPIYIYEDEVHLAPEQRFGNNVYKTGLFNQYDFANVLGDRNITDATLPKREELLIDPLTKEPVEYDYQLKFRLNLLNKKTWVNRWKHYNPDIKNNFPYQEIVSPIKDVNILNETIKQEMDRKQEQVLTQTQKLNFGLLPYTVFKYKIQKVEYFDSDQSKPLFYIIITVFRESEYYINTFAYKGYIDRLDNKINQNNTQTGKPVIFDVKYIGGVPMSEYLLSPGYSKDEIKQEIINKNFSNSPQLEKNADVIVQQVKNQQEAFKIHNQYGCFNLNIDISQEGDTFLNYYSKQECESNMDFYGREKTVGVWDKPCKKDEECPFYSVNTNYPNTFGKCMPDGKCQLPSNMQNIGYHYYNADEDYKPLCYNCKSSKFEISGSLDTCCDEQSDRTKYPFLKSPDYAYEGDFQARENFYYQNFCTVDANGNNLTCKDSDINQV